MTGPLVVVGDALLDRDLTGRVERISPDAPVPVFAEDGADDRPGGAALAAVLAASSTDRPVRLVTGIGRDPAGDRLRALLARAGVDVVELSYHGATAEKIRLHAGGQVVLRLDRGDRPGRFGPVPDAARAALRDAGAVLVSDYGRGACAVEDLRAAVADRAARRPVVCDPHPRGAPPVPGLRLITPNEKELTAIAPPRAGRGRLAGLADAAEQARRQWDAAALAVTLGPDGALLTEGGQTPLVVPAPAAGTGDTCGAGDRFAASAALALADGAVVFEAVQQAVTDATAFVTGQPVTHATHTVYGVDAALSLAESVRRRGGTVVATGGCFDLVHAGHVATLRAARSLGDCLVVCVNSDASVRALKGPSRPLVDADERASVVGALSCVDAVVVFDEPTPTPLLSRLRPDVWVKGGDYYLDETASGPALPEAEAVREWGGQAVVVPYLPGHSTSELIRAARGGDDR